MEILADIQRPKYSLHPDASDRHMSDDSFRERNVLITNENG